LVLVTVVITVDIITVTEGITTTVVGKGWRNLGTLTRRDERAGFLFLETGGN
jgi:hypothetical protein